MRENPQVLTTDTLMESASGLGPRRCFHCGRAVGDLHIQTCQTPRLVADRQLHRTKPKPPKYRMSEEIAGWRSR